MPAKLAKAHKMATMPTDPNDRPVIVADDSSLIRDNVRSALGPPWRVFVAANGVEAVEFARSLRAQLILLDVRMPRMDGIDACTRIRALPNYANVPIIMLTAYDSDEIRRQAQRAGATTVFSKPFTIEKLRAGIAPLLAASQDAAARAARELPIAAPPVERPPADASGLERGREALVVCRKVEAATEPRDYATFAEAMHALREQARR
jgi:CheY-like chemotaxis protein